MTSYKERQEKLHYFVLVKDGVPLGTFGNLKKIVEFMDGKKFPSYWTLARKKEFPISANDYELFTVKHH